MHEYSLAQSLLRQVNELRHERGASRVLAVKVRIGEFAGVEPDLLASAFDDLSIGTGASGAILQIDRVSLTIRCEACGQESEVVRYRFACPRCESQSVAITGGEEMLLESVTMECCES
jgi:hydrogenase nickel incorporation protein HypA/HybF